MKGLTKPLFCLLLAAILLRGFAESAKAGPPYQATGFKIGEVNNSSAIIWTRLTLKAERNPADGPMVKIQYAGGKEAVTSDSLPKANKDGAAKEKADAEQKKKQEGRQKVKKAEGGSRKVEGIVYPPGVTVADLRDAVPGAPGEVRVQYRPADASQWQATAWQPVDPDRDYTRQFTLTALRPNTRYLLHVESRGPGGGPAGQALDGRLLTAPLPDEPARVVFTVITGQDFPDKDRPDGFKIYPQMLKLDPSFFVHTGDIVYYDLLAKDISLARYHWQRTYGLPTNVEFHRQVASYFEKDDHDTWCDDCWLTKNDRGFMYHFTFAQGQQVFLEQVPMGESTYRTVRWGKDLQIWLPEGRDFRSPNNAPDGPQKTIWGEKQKAWFKQTVQQSDATFRVLIDQTPVVGPDRTNKADNLSNKAFQHEGDEIRQFIAGQKNMVVICGDRHWQYVSVDPKTGVREWSCGPASNQHAGGWKQSDLIPEYHRYLNVIGGFLAATVERQNGKPTLTFRHYGVEGDVKHEDRLVAE
jgi:alkaline phosphatase D